MKLFVDTNLLVAVLNKEYPLFSSAAKILSLADKPHITVCTSPICISIAFYFASKKSGEKQAKEKIAILLEHIKILSVTEENTKMATANIKVRDLEDGIQYYCAEHYKCDYIITEDIEGFYFRQLPAIKSKAFLLNVIGGH